MKLLTTVKELFDQHDIKFWPMYGTLLGFIRDKDFIEWDYDIDLGAWFYDYDKIVKLKEDIKKAGYEIEFQNGKYSIVTIRTPASSEQIHKTALGKQGEGLELDIGFWIKDREKAVSFLYRNTNVFSQIFDGMGRALNQDYYFRRTTRLSQNTRKKIGRIVGLLPVMVYNFLSEVIHSLHMYTTIKVVMPYEGYSQTEMIIINGVEFMIPSNWQYYLESTYGKGWKTPNKNWSTKDEEEFDKSCIKYIIKEKETKDIMRKRYNIE